MGKLAVRPSPVNPSVASVPLYIRHQIEARAVCPWCGSSMYLDRSGNRLLCVDSIHCAGVMDVSIPPRTLVREVA